MVGRRIDLKKHSAELKLTKSNKISDWQKRFAARVTNKELPYLRDWMIKQASQHSEVQKKIEVEQIIYQRNVTLCMRNTDTQDTKVQSIQRCSLDLRS